MHRILKKTIYSRLESATDPAEKLVIFIVKQNLRKT
jgi:hypothetical protein